MPSQVTLIVVRGKLKGEQFVFDGRDTCIVGRSKECQLQIPNDDDHRTISRHHCLLDINPPDIRVRDFGSRNGTYVNGKKIGQRQAGKSREEAQQDVYDEHDLVDGDKIKLGKTVFRVSILIPEVCSTCGVEIPDEEVASARDANGVLHCVECRNKVMRTVIKSAAQQHDHYCSRCGREVEAGTGRTGELICPTCQTDALELVKDILGRAKSGREDLPEIEDYIILRKLGQGGMGAAFQVLDAKDKTQKVLKVMLPRVAVDVRSKDMFLREAFITQQLDHPHVVRQFENGYSKGTFFITQEFCELGSLDQIIDEKGPRPIDYAIPLIQQVLNGLEYAHQAEVLVKLENGAREPRRGVVHRDIKPANIFLRGDERVPTPLIGDFGLAKAFDAAGLSGQTRSGSKVGTPYFMCRQQVVNYKYSKPDVDVWAVAATLYNLLTGAYPRELKTRKEPFSTILSTMPTPIREHDRSIPRRLAEVIDTALIDKPKLSFGSAREFKSALENAL